MLKGLPSGAMYVLRSALWNTDALKHIRRRYWLCWLAIIGGVVSFTMVVLAWQLPSPPRFYTGRETCGAGANVCEPETFLGRNPGNPGWVDFAQRHDFWLGMGGFLAIMFGLVGVETAHRDEVHVLRDQWEQGPEGRAAFKRGEVAGIVDGWTGAKRGEFQHFDEYLSDKLRRAAEYDTEHAEYLKNHPDAGQA